MKNLWIFDERRLRLLEALLGCESACGCDLRQALNIKKPLFSYHLRMLEKGGFVEETKCGREKQYRIRPQKKRLVRKILTIVN